MKIAIIDYGMGNLHSIAKALKRVGGNIISSSDPRKLENAKKFVLPGVGYFKRGMENLNKLGLISFLNKKIIKEKSPILGICLGMQLLTNFSEEGNVKGLRWFNAKTIKFNLEKNFKIPHMGWNNIKITKKNPLLEGIDKEELFYFVHSFHVNCKEKKDILSTTKYGEEFVSSINKKNIFGVQFHPEKSHHSGLKILRNFLERI
jgi:glutamine amidotransferase